MNDGADIFANLLANPADDAIRGVLADWLNDNGHDALSRQFRLAMPDREFTLYIEAIRAATELEKAWIMTTSPTSTLPNSVSDAHRLLSNLFSKFNK